MPQISEYAVVASTLYEAYEEYVDAGFSEERALALTQLMLAEILRESFRGHPT